MLTKVRVSLPGRLLLAGLCAGTMAQAGAQVQTGQPSGAPSRIGFVLTVKIMTESKAARTADERIHAEFAGRQKQCDDMVKRYKDAREKFDNDVAHMSDAERVKRTRELLDLEKDVQRMQHEFNEDLLQRENEEREAIAEKARKLIAQVAEEEHLDVVVQDAVWASPRVDLTDRIMKLLDK